MKISRRYWIAGGVILASVLLVLLVPGTADRIEQILLLFMTSVGRPS